MGPVNGASTLQVGKQSRTIAPNGAVTAYTPDALGNCLTESSSDRGTLQATYDNAGNLYTRTDARSIIANYRFDALNRLITVSFPTAGEDITFTYDASPAGSPACTNGLGRLCQVQDAGGTTNFAYDAQGNPNQQVLNELGLAYTSLFQYDSVNRLKQITTPGNRTTVYSRNAVGQINSFSGTVNGASITLASNIAYNALSQTTAQKFANGYSESLNFNTNDQPIGESESHTPPPPSTLVPVPDWALVAMAIIFAAMLTGYSKKQSQARHLAVTCLLVFGLSLSTIGLICSAAYAPLVIQYDANGNVKLRTDGSGATTFTYDALDRLWTEAGPNKTQTIGYDANGNRTSDGAGSYTYTPNTNLMQTARGVSIGRDKAGNVTSDGNFNYTYNQAGQMAQALKGQTLTATYIYNWRGLRARKQVGSQITLFHYDLGGHLTTESDALGNILTTYIYRDDTPVVIINSSSGADIVLYIEVDHLNTPRVARNQNGVVVWTWYSDAFGSTPPNEDPDGDGVLTHINLRFPGQYFDVETGLMNNWARYYNPNIPIYYQPDPIGLAGGLNPLIYVRNNPLNLIDPTGLVELMPGQNPLVGGTSGLGGGGLGGGSGLGAAASEISVAEASALRATPSPALLGTPYNPSIVLSRIRPPYQTNPAHDPSSPLFNPRKTPEPSDACDVYNSSVRGGIGTWYGRGENGDIYRFFSDNAGSSHFSGTLPSSQVPNVILKQLGD